MGLKSQRSKVGRRARLYRVVEVIKGRRSLLSSEWYQPLFIMLFCMTIIFSVLDLYLTEIGLRVGLSETNLLLLAISRGTGFSVIDALGVAKLAFIGGGGLACVIGLGTRDAKVRTWALVLMTLLAILLLVAAANNVYWISGTI